MRDLVTGDEGLVVSDNTTSIFAYGWRPDSTALVYDYGCGLYEVSRDGTNVRLLWNENCRLEPSVNPVDGRLAFASAAADVGLLVSDSEPSSVNVAKIPGTHPGQHDPVWSPDGEWIQFSDNDAGTNLFRIRPDGTGSTPLTAFTGTDVIHGPGAWTADGSQIVIPATIQGTNGLYLVNADGSGYFLLRANTGGPDYDGVGSINRCISTCAHSARSVLRICELEE